MKVLVVSSYDSFLRAGDRFARRLEAARGASLSHAIVHLRQGQLSPAQFRAIGLPTLPTEPLGAIVDKARLAPFDVIVLALNGVRTRRFMNSFRQLWNGSDRKRPIVLSLYPGLIFRFHLDGFMSRQSSDLVLLSSKSDVALYNQMLASMGIEQSNATLAGLSFMPSRGEPVPTGSDVVFVGQPTVPAGKLERLYVVERMVSLARRYPDTTFTIKPRHRQGEKTLHRMRYHYQTLIDENRIEVPANLRFSYDSMETVLEHTGLLLTFSSTAALEAMARGIPTRLLTDIGINENIGNFWFMGSGALAQFDDIDPKMPLIVDEAWYQRNASSADDCFPNVLERIDALLDKQEQLGKALPPPHNRLFGRTDAFTRFVTDRDAISKLEDFGDVRISSRLRRLGAALRDGFLRFRLW